MSAHFEADVVIIGSGVAGSLVAWRLAEAKLKVLILEAGPRIDRVEAFKTYLAARDKNASSPYPPAPYAPAPQYIHFRRPDLGTDRRRAHRALRAADAIRKTEQLAVDVRAMSACRRRVAELESVQFGDLDEVHVDQVHAVCTKPRAHPCRGPVTIFAMQN